MVWTSSVIWTRQRFILYIFEDVFTSTTLFILLIFKPKRAFMTWSVFPTHLKYMKLLSSLLKFSSSILREDLKNFEVTLDLTHWSLKHSLSPNLNFGNFFTSAYVSKDVHLPLKATWQDKESFVPLLSWSINDSVAKLRKNAREKFFKRQQCGFN